jgi:prepilin-type N-terminal cleavage/methylation domain-containing protein
MTAAALTRLFAAAVDRVRGGHMDGASDDDGFTMMETVVAMTLTAIFLAMFTTALVSLYGTSNKADAVSQTSVQLNIAFQRVDKQIRYASAISAPNDLITPGNAWYTEFVNTSSGQDVCTQLRLSDGVLSERTWTGVPTSIPGFTVLASNLTQPTSSPFTFYAATGTQTQQRLRLTVAAPVVTANTNSGLNVTFSAMNSGQSSSTNDGATLVCQNAGARP